MLKPHIWKDEKTNRLGYDGAGVYALWDCKTPWESARCWIRNLFHDALKQTTEDFPRHKSGLRSQQRVTYSSNGTQHLGIMGKI